MPTPQFPEVGYSFSNTIGTFHRQPPNFLRLGISSATSRVHFTSNPHFSEAGYFFSKTQGTFNRQTPNFLKLGTFSPTPRVHFTVNSSISLCWVYRLLYPGYISLPTPIFSEAAKCFSKTQGTFHCKPLNFLTLIISSPTSRVHFFENPHIS